MIDYLIDAVNKEMEGHNESATLSYGRLYVLLLRARELQKRDINKFQDSLIDTTSID